MKNFAVHMRIAGMHVSNEDVDTRWAAVLELALAWGKIKDLNQILEKAAEIAQVLGSNGMPSEAFGIEVEKSIQNHASAFLYLEKPLEVGICVGQAAINMLSTEPGTTGWLIADIYAAALWSALAFQTPLQDAKREALRGEVLKEARTRSMKSAIRARERTTVNDFGELALVAGDEAKLPASFKKATTATIEALRRNSALDREELDFLWWAQLGRSKLLGRQLSALSEPLRLVSTGIEAASLLRRFPSEAHRDIVLKTLDANPKLNLVNLMTDIAADQATLCEQLAAEVVTRSPSIFPLLHALLTGDVTAEGSSVERPCEEWGSRALLEASLVHLHSNGPGKL